MAHDPEWEAFERELAEMARGGQLIAAIKLYRERTSLGLKEAKYAVESLRDGGRLAPQDLASRTAPLQHTPELEAELLGLLGRGEQIEAIKRFRQATGRGLKESRDAVLELARRNGIEIRTGCFGVLLAAIGVWAVLAAAVAGRP